MNGPRTAGLFCYTDNMTSQSQISRDCDGASHENLQALYDMLLASRHCVAFTGAGVSTLSGIRDFRGKNGLYKTPNADNIFDIDIFRQDPSLLLQDDQGLHLRAGRQEAFSRSQGPRRAGKAGHFESHYHADC